MGLKGKVLNKKAAEKPVEEEEFDYEDHGLDPDDIDGLNLDFDDEEIDDVPAAAKPSSKKGKAPADGKKKSAKSKAPVEEEDEDGLNLDGLEIDDIDGDDLEAMAHADLTTSDLQGKGQSVALDVLSPILDRIGTLEEHVDVNQDNVLNRLKSLSGEVATVINNQAVHAKESVEIKDMLGSILGRITALEQCFRSLNELNPGLQKKGATKEVVAEEEPKVVKKTAKVARTPLPEVCGDADVRFVLTVVNKASGPVDYDKLTSALARKWDHIPDKVKAIPALLSHLGYKPGEKAVPGQFTYDKYKP